MLPDGMGWLAQASPELRSEIARRCDLIVAQEVRSLYWAGDPASGIFGVVSGRLDVHLPHWGGGRSLVHVLGPGWWVGDMAAISGELRRLDVTMHGDTRLMRLSRAEIGRICDRFPEMQKCLLAMMAANMRTLIEVVESLGFSDPTSRVGACLSRLDRTGSGWQGRLPVTQGELAVIARLSRRRTNAALNALEASGALRLRYREIEIRDRERLRELIETWESQ
jgi:CRP-like cAMP-binding protein